MVDHNHCDYNNRGEWNELEKRVNGHLLYINGHLCGAERCHWFWDKDSKEKPTKEGFFYTPPKGSYEKCPKIPYMKIKIKEIKE